MGRGYGTAARLIRPPQAYSAWVLGDSPTGYWRLHGATLGEADDDSSGNAWTLSTVSGTYTLNQAGALASDAGNTCILMSNAIFRTASSTSLDGAGDFSCECWLKFTSTALMVPVAVRDPNTTVRMYFIIARSGLAGDIGAETWAGQSYLCAHGVARNDGAWHYVVATYRAAEDTLRLYVDGVLVATKVQNGAANRPAQFSSAVQIASNGAAANQPFAGNIDEVVWHKDRCLSPAVIAARYLAAAA